MSDLSKKREQFLKSLPNSLSACEITKLCHRYKKEIDTYLRGYDIMTRAGANNCKSNLKKEDLQNFYKSLYDLWYDFMQSLDPRNYTGESQNAIIKIQGDTRFSPKNMTPKKCEEFIFGGYDKEFRGSGFRIMQSQEGDNPYSGNFINSDFLHVHPFTRPDNIDCRLYVNLLPENAIKVGTLILQDSLKNKRKTYFKFSTTTGRNDTFLIYTNYSRVQEFVDILRKIKTEQPELFEGCENTFPFLPTIDGFIGFGEEPKYKHSSFNLERADAINEFYRDNIKQELINIGNYKGLITTSEDKEMGIEDYLKYRILKSFRETIAQNQYNIAQKKYPEKYKTQKQIDSYVRAEREIYEICKDNIPQPLQIQLEKRVKDIMENLKKGKTIFTQYFNFGTNLVELSPYSEDYSKQLLAQGKTLPYSYNINIDLNKKLFDVFGVMDNIEKKITPENVNIYFEKHHIDPELTFLNTETTEQLKTEKLL